MCGNLRPRAALEIIQNGWMPQKVVAREVRRGHV
jgi:S-adenosylmethionine/arginine decarboxylase-like enzyme